MGSATPVDELTENIDPILFVTGHHPDTYRLQSDLTNMKPILRGYLETSCQAKTLGARRILVSGSLHDRFRDTDSPTNVIIVFDLRSMHTEFILKEPHHPEQIWGLTSLASSSDPIYDPSRIVSSSGQGRPDPSMLAVWDSQSGECLKKFDAALIPTNPISLLSVHENSWKNHLFVGGYNQIQKIDMISGEVAWEYSTSDSDEGHVIGQVNGLAGTIEPKSCANFRSDSASNPELLVAASQSLSFYAPDQPRAEALVSNLESDGSFEAVVQGKSHTVYAGTWNGSVVAVDIRKPSEILRQFEVHEDGGSIHEIDRISETRYVSVSDGGVVSWRGDGMPDGIRSRDSDKGFEGRHLGVCVVFGYQHEMMMTSASDDLDFEESEVTLV